jgi:hypothetical protein
MHQMAALPELLTAATLHGMSGRKCFNTRLRPCVPLLKKWVGPPALQLVARDVQPVASRWQLVCKNEYALR